MIDMENMESNNFVPKLTLTSDIDQVSSIMPDKQLTVSEGEISLQKKGTEELARKVEDTKLTEQEMAAIEEFSKQIDIRDTNMILQYGADAQSSIAQFSQNALESVKTKDLGEVGDALTDLVTELKTFDTEDRKGILGFFQRKTAKLSKLKTQYNKASVNVEKITEMLEEHQVSLMKDVAMLDSLYNLNLQYFKQLTMYIIAGKKKLAYVREGELAEIERKAKEQNSAEISQQYNDLAEMCNRFEKKLYDLELTRTISLQMGPQTRLIQNNDIQMIEKIQSSIVNTIPLWKSQMVLAIGIENQRQATKAQSAVANMTNDMLKKNADMLKMGTLEVARESERSIVDIETLKHTNEQLISTLDEVLQIQKEGKQKRMEAEGELSRIEEELKQKLLQSR